MRPLLIRADAGARIGAGHVMRCLALAQAWREAGGEACLAAACLTPAIQARLEADGVNVAQVRREADAPRVIGLAREKGAEWAAVDGYGFDAGYQDALRDAGLRVLFLDDYGHAGRYAADLVLNQNLHAAESLYRDRAARTGLLLGPRFALVRREFREAAGGARPVAQEARRILITLGGADARRVTATVIDALGRLNARDLEAVVVAGPANPLAGQLQDMVQQLPFHARVEENPRNLPELMTWADLGISAAGSTCWELALLGTPTLAIVCADNQAAGAERLEQAGAIESLGDSRDITPLAVAQAAARLLESFAARARLRENARRLVDGQGARRVVRRMLAPLRLRAVRHDDCRLLWDWANDPEVRAAAFSSAPIAWAEHVEWFRRKLLEGRSTQWIALDREGAPVGQVRFDPAAPAAAVIDVSVAREHRARGYGAELLETAVEELFETADVREVHAHVKVENRASLAAFRRAQFASLGKERVGDCEAEHFVIRKDDA